MARRASVTASRVSATIRPFSQPIVIPSRPSGRTALRTTRSSTADQLADALGTQRHLAHPHAEGRERVLDRLGDEGRHRNSARLTHAHTVERSVRTHWLEAL